jgi:ABC-2 type transport system ATP-binding protein
MDVVEEPRAVHRMMGYLSDFFGLYQDLTVAHCLEYAAAAQGLPQRDIAAAVERTAQRLGLSERLQQTSGSLSRGLRQRVAIGQAIIHQPRLLLLDEPASGLDPEARASLAALFRQLQADGMTLLVSSHILAELDEYSTHMLALRAGSILENRPLTGQNHAAAHRHLLLELAGPDARLAAWLQAYAQVTLKEADETHAEFDLHGDVAEQAALLKALVSEGFAVSSLALHKENLQQSYLRTVAAHEEGRP